LTIEPEGRKAARARLSLVDLSNVTLTQLRYLLAVDRFRSFRLAAEHCHVSQPALSMQLGKLEEMLGLTLLDRSRQPVVPTERGAAVIAQARTIVRETERLGDVAREHDAIAGRYRLGVLPSLAPTLVPAFLPAFSRRHPEVELVVDEVQTDPMIQRLQDDALDGGIAVTPLGIPSLHERPLFQEPFWVYLSPRHPLTKRARVRQSDLVGEKLWLMPEGHCFRTQVLQLCRADRSASEESTRFESGSFETLVRLVDAGLGLTILPELWVNTLPARRRRAQIRPFAPPVPVRQVSFVHFREHLHRAIADALIATLLGALEELGEENRGATRLIAPVATE
jgi:LysR family transcriptional regulator, hydrogen peroxide-inducible genes activator